MNLCYVSPLRILPQILRWECCNNKGNKSQPTFYWMFSRHPPPNSWRHENNFSSNTHIYEKWICFRQPARIKRFFSINSSAFTSKNINMCVCEREFQDDTTRAYLNKCIGLLYFISFLLSDKTLHKSFKQVNHITKFSSINIESKVLRQPLSLWYKHKSFLRTNMCSQTEQIAAKGSFLTVN